MKQNLVALSVNISRAYEIAKAGNHTLSIIPGQSDNKTQMKGNCATLRHFYNAGEGFNSDIIVELADIDANDILASYGNRYETIDDINVRIKTNPIDSDIEIILSGSVQSLLKSAIDKLSLSIWQVNAIISVSKTIAGIGGSKTVKIEHIAEAIQYQSAKPAEPVNQ